jgi:hypothetical protein
MKLFSFLALSSVAVFNVVQARADGLGAVHPTRAVTHEFAHRTLQDSESGDEPTASPVDNPPTPPIDPNSPPSYEDGGKGGKGSKDSKSSESSKSSKSSKSDSSKSSKSSKKSNKSGKGGGKGGSTTREPSVSGKGKGGAPSGKLHVVLAGFKFL